MKRTITKLLLVFFLMVIYAYTLSIQNIPDNIVVFEGETISFKTLFGIQTKIDVETMETASNSNNNTVSEKKSEKATVNVSLFNQISLKEVNVDILPKTTVIPCREYSRS